MDSGKSVLSPTNQRGLTLLEFLIVIGLVAVVIGVGLLMFTQSRNGSREVETTTKVLGLVSAIKQIYHGSDYSTLTGGMLVQSSTLARSMSDGNGNLVAPWGSAITVGPATYAGRLGATYSIAFAWVAPDQCVALVRDTIGPFLRVQVDAVVLKDLAAAPIINFTDTASIVAACKGPTNHAISLISS